MSEFRKAKQPVAEPEAPAPSQAAPVADDAVTSDAETLPTSPSAESSPSAKYLEVENIYQKHDSMREEVADIDSYIKGLQATGRVDKSDKAIATFMKDLESKAGAKPFESVNQRMTKILAYIRFRRVVDGSTE